jgi:hypothetical protein
MNRNHLLMAMAAALAAIAMVASIPAWAQAEQGKGQVEGGPHASAPAQGTAPSQAGVDAAQGAGPEQASSAAIQAPRATGRVSAPYGDTQDSSSAGTSVSNANVEAQKRADCFDRSSGQQRVTPQCAQYSAVAPGWPGHGDPEGIAAQ